MFAGRWKKFDPSRADRLRSHRGRSSDYFITSPAHSRIPRSASSGTRWSNSHNFRSEQLDAAISQLIFADFVVVEDGIVHLTSREAR
jgi:hypothetical protein